MLPIVRSCISASLIGSPLSRVRRFQAITGWWAALGRDAPLSGTLTNNNTMLGCLPEQLVSGNPDNQRMPRTAPNLNSARLAARWYMSLPPEELGGSPGNPRRCGAT